MVKLVIRARPRLTNREKAMARDWCPYGPNKIQTEWTLYGFPDAAAVRAHMAKYGVAFDPAVHRIEKDSPR